MKELETFKNSLKNLVQSVDYFIFIRKEIDSVVKGRNEKSYYC